MNPAITAALIAATHQEDAKQAIFGKLREGKALSSTSAMPLDLPDDKREALDEAIAAGTVVRTADGRFYVNERVLADRSEGQGFMVVLVILIAGSLIASGAVLALSLAN